MPSDKASLKSGSQGKQAAGRPLEPGELKLVWEHLDRCEECVHWVAMVLGAWNTGGHRRL